MPVRPHMDPTAPPSNTPHYSRHLMTLTCGEVDDGSVGEVLDPLDLFSEDEPGPVAPHRVHEGVHHLTVREAQQLRAGVDDRDAGRRRGRKEG